MSDINNITLTGRLTRDPYTSEKVTAFTIAVNRDYKTNGEYEADFPQIVTFQKLAERCSLYLKRGSRVGIVGAIRTRSYQDDNNKTVYKTEIVANSVKFLDPAPRENDSNVNQNNGGNNQDQNSYDDGYFNDSVPYKGENPWEY